MTPPLLARPSARIGAGPQRALGAYLGSFGSMGICTMLLGPSLSTFQRVSSTPASAIGVLFTASSVGYLIGVTASGQWCAHRNAHSALRIGTVLLATGVAILPSAHSLVALFLGEVILGCGLGWMEIPANSAVLWRFGSGRAINALHAAFAIGAVVSPIIVGRSLAWTDGVGTAYAIAAGVALLPLTVLRGTTAPANPHVEIGRGVPRGARTLVAFGTLFYVGYVGVEITFAGWIYRYAEARGFSGGGGATLYGTVFLAAFAVGRVTGIAVARRHSPLTMLYADHGLALAALGLLALVPRSPVVLIAMTALFGIGISSMFASMLGLSGDTVAATGTVTSIYLVGSSLGAMTLPFVTGKLLAQFGPGAFPLVAMTSTLVTLVAVIGFAHTARRRAEIGDSR